MNEERGFRLGSILGTTIHLEVTFLILVGLFVILDLERGLPIERALLWIPILLISVLVHELGHAATIGLLGFGPSRIALAGFGGQTVNQRRSRPWQDILISFAGPLSSFLLAFILFFLQQIEFFRTDPMMRALIPLMLFANIAWGILNLVPVYPLDGGHMLWNVGRIVVDDRKAFVFSVWTSIILGVAVIVAAVIFRQIFLAVIAGMLVFQNVQRWQAYREFTRRDE